jgi:hypothetical protein
VVISPAATFRIDSDLLVYSWSAGSPFAAKTQSDLVVTAGLGLAFGR